MNTLFKKVILLFLLSLGIRNVIAQSVEYKYDYVNRLKEVIYPNLLKVTYEYDKDGNRMSQATSQIRVGTKDIELANQQVLIYPNPTNGNFNGKIDILEKQEITIEIFNLSGQSIHTYKVEADVGTYDFSINISPIATGTYLLSVIGKTIKANGKVYVID
jgi:hypothetical protein